MPRSLLFVALLELTSCASIYRAVAGDSRLAPARAAGAKTLSCGAEGLTVEERDSFHEMQFLVTGCGRTVACQEIEDQWRCFENPPRIRDFAGERMPNGFQRSSEAVAQQTGCRSADARISRQSERLVVALCDRVFICSVNKIDDELTAEPQCQETPESVEETARKVAIDRLALETGCSAGKIEMVDQTSWSRGTEKAYRFNACGSAFICTTAAGRTDCKAALVDAAPAAPPP